MLQKKMEMVQVNEKPYPKIHRVQQPFLQWDPIPDRSVPAGA